jgi:hypothetical protein
VAIDPQLAQAFDPHWYLSHNPDVAAAGIQPWDHFVANGLREGRSPGDWFDPGWYVGQDPGAVADPAGAFGHYLASGMSQGRYPNPAWLEADRRARRGPDGAPRNLPQLLARLAVERRLARAAAAGGHVLDAWLWHRISWKAERAGGPTG